MKLPLLPRVIFSKDLNLTCFYSKVSTNELNKKGKSVSSQNWLSRQLSDPYVEKAKVLNYRCRSAFKLLEIDERFRILEPGFTVIDCGASPGSWTQVAVRKVNANRADPDQPIGKVISIDRQLIYPIEGAVILGNTDFTSPETETILIKCLGGEKADCIISDMAPNASGLKYLDNENILKLCYAVLKFAIQNSKIGSSLLVKLWNCGEMKKLESDINRFYSKVRVVKPKSSRTDSAEIFMLGREFKGLKT